MRDPLEQLACLPEVLVLVEAQCLRETSFLIICWPSGGCGSLVSSR